MEYASRSIPVATKRAVVARDGMACFWCGIAVTPGVPGTYRPDQIHYDHVTPWAYGGDHSVDNLVVSCARCNLTRPRPRFSVRPGEVAPLYRYGKHWWPDSYTPPRLVDPARCAWPLAAVARERREPIARTVQLIHRGLLAATGPGEAICVDTPDYETTNKVERRRRRM